MNKKVFLALFIITFLLSGYPTIKGVQANPPFQIAQSIWKPFSSSEGGFTVLMPGIPTEENNNVTTKFGSLTVHTFYVRRNDEALYAVAYSDLPDNISENSSDIEQLLAEAPSGFSEGAGGRLVNQQPISLGNFPGREFRLELSEGAIARGRIYLVNKRLYQVVVGTNNERNLTKSIQGFLNSFQLLKESSPLPNPESESEE